MTCQKEKHVGHPTRCAGPINPLIVVITSPLRPACLMPLYHALKLLSDPKRLKASPHSSGTMFEFLHCFPPDKTDTFYMQKFPPLVISHPGHSSASGSFSSILASLSTTFGISLGSCDDQGGPPPPTLSWNILGFLLYLSQPFGPLFWFLVDHYQKKDTFQIWIHCKRVFDSVLTMDPWHEKHVETSKLG